jgi:acetylornithine deacetylase/succinyl-diaminopimelate desuccinylase-like protein
MDTYIDLILENLENIQKIPSPTFDEKERAEFIFKEYLNRGLHNVQMDTLGNVYGFFPGGTQKSMVISAHLDTVHARTIPHIILKNEDTWSGPGIGDNTLALAAQIGLIEYFKNTKELPGGVWFVANVAEEGLGNLNGIKAVVDKFSNQVLAYLVLEGLGLGVIFHRGLGVNRYRLIVKTRGGHSWGDYGSPSAVHELSKMVAKFCDLQLPGKPKTTLNVGTITGGTTINSIADLASCDIDLRSVDPKILEILIGNIHSIIQKSQKTGVDITLEIIGQRPFGSIDSQHWMVKLAEDALERSQIRPILAIGSTDASYPLSLGYASVCVSLTRGGFVHTPKEYIELKPIRRGFEQLIFMIKNSWDYAFKDSTL